MSHMASIRLDDADELLLRALAADSRKPAAALAQVVGLTRQAVADRIERLKNDGVLTNFTVGIDPDRIGLTVRAFINITLMPACSEKQEGTVIQLLRESPWVQECYRITGDDYFQVRVVAPEISMLRELVIELRATHVVQSTRTVFVLETLFEKSSIGYGDVCKANLVDSESESIDGD
jgi:Lrp/AsnC family transcriptional regulator, leucine-responsive regulatory protein